MKAVTLSDTSNRGPFSQGKIVWAGAFIVFALAALIGSYVSWQILERHHSFVLPVVGLPVFFEPLFIALAANKKILTRVSDVSDARTISRLIAALVMATYALFIFGLAFALLSIGRHSG